MATGSKILIVEDEPIISMEIETRLQNLGYVISGVVSTGEKAIQKTAESSPDLVLMDIMLEKGMDGIETSTQIRAHFDIPIIYITAYADSNTLERARITEPFGYLIKPFQERELHAAIEIALYKHGMEKKLRDSENLYRTLAESAQDAIYILDKKGRLQYVNHFASVEFGLIPNEIQGKTLDEFTSPYFSPEHIIMQKSAIEKVFKSGKPVSFEFNIPILGNKTWVDVKMVPIMDQKGEVQQVMCISRNISERKLAEEAIWRSKEFTETVLNSMTDAISIIDVNDFNIIETNQAFSDLYGLIKEDCIGNHCYEISHNRAKPCALPDDICPLQEVLRTGKNSIVEHIHYLKHGKKQCVEVSASPITNENGIITSMVHVARDITERKRAEERLSKLNECFLSFGTDPLENINRLVSLCGELMGATAALYNRLDQGMLCSWGQWNTPPDYNPVDKPEGHICYDTIKIGSDEVLVVGNLEETGYASTDPNVKAYDLKTYIGRAVRLGNDYVGSLCVVYQNDFSPREDDKRLMGVIASAIAVEERRRQSEKSFMESELKFRSIVQSANDAIILADSRGRLILWNKGAQAIFGYSEEEMIGKPASFMIPDRYRKKVEHVMSTGKSEFFGKTIESTGYRKDGSEFPLEISMATWNIEKEAYYSVIIRDITERKFAEKKLREASLYTRSLVEANLDPLVIINLEGKITDVNKAAELVTGLPREKLIGSDYSSYLTEPEKANEGFRLVLSRGFVLGYPLTIRHISGKITEVLFNASVFKNEAGDVQGVFTAARDITERIEGEKALKESEERYRKLVELSPIAIAVHSEGKVVFANTAAAKLIGALDSGQLVGKNISEIVHPESRKLVDERIGKMLEKGEVVPPTEEKFIRLDGSVLDVEVAAMPFPYKGKQGIQVIAHDITERKRAEEMQKERARAELYGFIVSALPVFASNVPSSVRDNLVRNFAERFEKNIRPRFEKELQQIGYNQIRNGIKVNNEMFDILMLWLVSIFSNLGIKTNINPGKKTTDEIRSQIEFLNCPWIGDARGNPIFCFICRAIAIRSFAWTYLKGNLEQKCSIANGSKTCRFEIIIKSIP